ncbi:hypothetical protein BWO91_14335 [Plantibacter flavus]|uniref:hypothetical protein n=1 Tax=Plantibacter flavus TaxID=150123 RepID=UPI00099C9079|nr:hypothetical protein [Plantibacter flavus]AQX80986.1 hypothetical protein BWO91_14335 [Plantibacter flavus]
MNGTLVSVDARKRVSLGSMAHHDNYIAREEPNGTIIFEPAFVYTAAEQAFLGDPALVALLANTEATNDRRKTRTTGRAKQDA